MALLTQRFALPSLQHHEYLNCGECSLVVLPQKSTSALAAQTAKNHKITAAESLSLSQVMQTQLKGCGPTASLSCSDSLKCETCMCSELLPSTAEALRAKREKTVGPDGYPSPSSAPPREAASQLRISCLVAEESCLRQRCLGYILAAAVRLLSQQCLMDEKSREAKCVLA